MNASASAHALDDGASEPDWINAEMTVKAVVFRGYQRVHEDGRKFPELDNPALLPVVVHQAGDKFGR